ELLSCCHPRRAEMIEEYTLATVRNHADPVRINRKQLEHLLPVVFRMDDQLVGTPIQALVERPVFVRMFIVGQQVVHGVYDLESQQTQDAHEAQICSSIDDPLKMYDTGSVQYQDQCCFEQNKREPEALELTDQPRTQSMILSQGEYFARGGLL